MAKPFVLLAVLALVTMAGCADRKPDRVDTLIDLDCGSLKVRFQERMHVVDSLAGVYNYTELLLIGSGTGWRQVDSAGHGGSSGHRGGPEAFSRLLPRDMAFRAFALGDRLRPDDREHSRWGVFVDPKVASRAEYDVIAQCLEKNLPAIDRAFEAARRPGEAVGEADQRRRLSSIVYDAYDDELDMCGEKTVGGRWECPGGGYVKTRLNPPHLILCAVKQRKSTSFITFLPVGMWVGTLSADQKTVALWKPDTSSYDYRTLLAGKDAQAYYAACRDRAGRGLFEVFPPAPAE